jgi:ATP-binding cassette, subfamily B, bacterial
VSGGQRQRIALARALLRPAGLLILDEPTSAVDVKIEEGIFREIWPLLKRRTTLIVTHRLNVIQRADLIHVLMGGLIRQSGTHAELAGCEGIYRDLVQLHSERPLPGNDVAVSTEREGWVRS